MPEAAAAATRRTTALWYVVDRRWHVLPGVVGVRGAAPVPSQRAAELVRHRPSRDPARVAEWWDRWPEARVMLPAGGDFDVLDVPARPGADALARLLRLDQPALAPGPVAAVPGDAGGRYHFYVAAGAREDLAELLEWLDWGGIDLGVRGLGAGDLVAAPELPGDADAVAADGVSSGYSAYRAGGTGHAGAAPRWVHGALVRPPELVALLGIIADACHRWRLSSGR